MQTETTNGYTVMTGEDWIHSVDATQTWRNSTKVSVSKLIVLIKRVRRRSRWVGVAWTRFYSSLLLLLLWPKAVGSSCTMLFLQNIAVKLHSDYFWILSTGWE